jgi:S-DNA-T family DNA segregation ATPase FtsK/SpoIIIE
MAKARRGHAARERVAKQDRAWYMQDLLANVRPELCQYGMPMGCRSTGRNVYLPTVVCIDDGPPEAHIVRMLPGQRVAEYQAHAATIAEAFGVARVRMAREGHPHEQLVRVELLVDDPLTTPPDEQPVPLTSCYEHLLLGTDELGQRYSIQPYALGHTIIQGETGSGKSAYAYWHLGQLAAATDIVIAGSDPSGVLLRPFAGTVHEPWQELGTASIAAHAGLLRRLVAEMDARIAKLPDDTDHLLPTPDLPLIMVWLEEYVGLLRAASAEPKSKGYSVRAEIEQRVGRLISEGRKAAIRVVLMVQRADADEINGFIRGQTGLRISLRADPDGLRMLHPVTREGAELHGYASPGIALLSAPTVRLARLRLPYLGDPLYARYASLVRTHASKP